MSDRTIEIERIPTNIPNKYIVVDLLHNKGRRYYFLSINPITIEQHNGWESKSFTLFSGKSRHVEDCKRYSAKRMAELAVKVKGTYADIVQEICAAQELEVVA